MGMLIYGDALTRNESILVSLLRSKLRYLLALAISLPIAWFYVGVPQLLAWSSGFGFPLPLATGSFADFVFWSSTLFALSSIMLSVARTIIGRGYVLFAFALGALAGPYVVIVLGGMVDEILSVAFGPLGLAGAYVIAISATIVALIGVFLWGWKQMKPVGPNLRTGTT